MECALHLQYNASLSARIRDPSLGLRLPLRHADHLKICIIGCEVAAAIHQQPCTAALLRDAVLYDLFTGVHTLVKDDALASLYADLIRVMNAVAVREVCEHPDRDWATYKLACLAQWLRVFAHADADAHAHTDAHADVQLTFEFVDKLLSRCLRASMRAQGSNPQVSTTSDACCCLLEMHCARCASIALGDALTSLHGVPSTAALDPSTARSLVQKMTLLQQQGGRRVHERYRWLVQAMTLRLMGDSALADLVLPIPIRDPPPSASQLVSIAAGAWTRMTECEAQMRAGDLLCDDGGGSGGGAKILAGATDCFMSIKLLTSCCSVLMQQPHPLQAHPQQPHGMRRRAVRMLASVACSTSKVMAGMATSPVDDNVSALFAACMVGLHVLVRRDDSVTTFLVLVPHVRRAIAKVGPRGTRLFLTARLLDIVVAATGRRDLLDVYCAVARSAEPAGDLLHDVIAAHARVGRSLEGSAVVEEVTCGLAESGGLCWCHYAGCVNLAGPSEFALKTFACGESRGDSSICQARYCGRACQVAAWRAGHSSVCRCKIVS